ncbi:MAG TPA: hypothetical protein VKA46_20930 [Gemmataceae bacterium]|nr:hypothetical protein [Gemmataceae bacterium]
MNSGEFSFRPPRTVIALCAGLSVLGGAALAVGLLQSPERAWLNVLLVSYYLLSLGLGALVFVALQYVTGARWSVALRRVPEAMAAVLPFAALGLGLVFLARPSLYPWAGAAAGEAGAASPLRHAWFNWPFFLARAVLYLACWLVLGFALVFNSRRQDRDGDPARTRANVRLSAAFLVVFALTFWLASQDWLMSLDGEWSSTMFAVYQFGGLFLGGLAGITLLAACLRRLGPFREVFAGAHVHDLGKLLFGFSSFWMYLWFCQYMLIWYVDNPEETVWFTRRLHEGWGPLIVLSIVLNWAIPLAVLLPRATKQHAGVLAAVSLVILVGRWLDLYLQILPRSGGAPLAGAAWEIGLAAGAAGLFGLVFFAALGRAPLVPVGDPFLAESLPEPNSFSGGSQTRAALRAAAKQE